MQQEQLHVLAFRPAHCRRKQIITAKGICKKGFKREEGGKKSISEQITSEDSLFPLPGSSSRRGAEQRYEKCISFKSLLGHCCSTLPRKIKIIIIIIKNSKTEPNCQAGAELGSSPGRFSRGRASRARPRQHTEPLVPRAPLILDFCLRHQVCVWCFR